MPPDMTEEERARRRAKNLELIRQFRLMDNPFMGRVFQGDLELGQLLAMLMTGRNDLTVTSVITEHELKNLHGRSVRLDIHAFDHDKKEIDIEIQRAKKGATPKRIRYNSAMMDSNFLVQSEDFEDLPEQYIFFVTENDVNGLHQLLSPVEKRLGKGLTIPYDDGIHIAFIDSSKADDSPLGKLMHDFRCRQAEEMYYPLLKEKVRYYKENKKGGTIMSDMFEKYLQEEPDAGKSEGKREMILGMIEDHDPLAKIMKISKWSADQIRALAEKNGLAVE